MVCGPLILAVAFGIKLDSEGQVFYRAPRTGRGGSPFTMLKFRTMVVNADQLGGTSTSQADQRLTRLGRIIRKYKIDEVPQLFNVLKGDMSMVGPRPEVEEYTSLYSDKEIAILKVRPGVTDYASIRFRNLNAILATVDDVDQYYKDHVRPEKNKLRLKYALNHSFWIDLKILFQTVWVIIFKNPWNIKNWDKPT